MLAALQVAAQLHAGQTRKHTSIPYIAHLLGVCSIALEYGADEEEAIAALLHDAIEDVEPVEMARAAVSAFGPRVLGIVEACSDADVHPKPKWSARKRLYIKHLAEVDGSVLLVSAADKLHNARAIVADLRAVGPDLWQRFNAGRTHQLWYYCALVKAFRSNPAHNPSLVDELGRVVAEMIELASAPSAPQSLPPASRISSNAIPTLPSGRWW